MLRKISLCVFLFLLCQMTFPELLTAQESKGKLGRFEDANKGEKSDDDDNDDDDAYEDDESGGCGSFIIEMIFRGLFEGIFSGDDDETGYVDSFTGDEGSWTQTDSGLVFTGDNDGYDSYTESESGYEEHRPDGQAFIWPTYSYGRYPYDPSGTIYASGVGKSFMGRISGGYQKLDDHTFGYHLNGQIQLARRHGVEFDLVDYREDLGSSTDHLQVFGLHYRYLVYGNDQVAVVPSAGIKIFQPDKLKDADVGLEMAIAVNWFFTKPLSLNTRLAFAPIVDEINAETSPTLFDLEFGLGAHFYYFELSGTYRTLIPSYDPGAALHGPELGLRIWF